ncbi:hypothetical protein [Olsenella uli]|uniref:hypothetical protein n=1 Tax=Olsenella uli TaxID=133926 RepID=UPI0028E96025|nr:hypothetical protein [Olsenella uli]
MRKIINGKAYDTETAHEVGGWGRGSYGDFDSVEETLYRKKTGEYFIYGHGGARTRYAKTDELGDWTGGSEIIPVSLDRARKWAEGHLDADEYETEFGPVSEDGGDEVVSARVSAAAKRALEREAQRTGESQTAVLERLLLSLREG